LIFQYETTAIHETQGGEKTEWKKKTNHFIKFGTKTVGCYDARMTTEIQQRATLQSDVRMLLLFWSSIAFVSGVGV
jgi:hypothetical protein